MMTKIVGYLSVTLILFGCSIKQTKSSKPMTHTHPNVSNNRVQQNSLAAINVRQKLLNHYQLWRGTPYQYGGLSNNGVDCSGFVFLAFKNSLGKIIPRTTRAQSRQGKSVSQSKLQVGDLVFFNTKKTTQHVGIYIGNKEFIHASTSRGVMISRLDNPYWQSVFWKAKRLFGK